MSMGIDEKFDLFIAYHGDEKSGSVETARKIYNKLICHGKNIYFHPVTNSIGAYKDTHRFVQNSTLFLFVVNKNICRNDRGLMETKNDKYLDRRIWQEVDSFRESMSNKKYGSIVSRLYLCSDISVDDYEDYTNLDSIFNGKDCFFEDDFSDVEKWMLDSLNYLEESQINQDSICNKGSEQYWNSEMANTWHKISPPSRPSKSEIEIYRKYLKYIKNNSYHTYCKALILGSTIEFRELADSEEFHATVVDVSEEYYREISSELEKPLENEEVVFCDWLNMSEKIGNNSYDVVLGDLSIGNVKPDKIDILISQIAHILRPGGFLLGKTVFRVNNKNYKRTDIFNLFDEYFRLNIKDNIASYGFSMYPLSIFATDEDRKINFVNLFNLVCEIREKRQEHKNDNIFSVYTSEKTSFKDKMKLEFYVYDIGNFIDLCCNRFRLYDIEYGSDIYSKDFPLLIFTKIDAQIQKSSDNTVAQIYQDITDFLVSNGNMIDEWCGSLTSQYFLLNIINLLNSKGYLSNLIDKIYNKIFNYINEIIHITLDKNLNCVLDNICDMNVNFETAMKYPNIQSKLDSLNLVDHHENKIRINKVTDIPLKNNYLLGLLSYITWFMSNKKKSDANSLVIGKLFSKIENGSLWTPKDALWLSARISIAICPMYECLSKGRQLNIVEVIKRIRYLYDSQIHAWNKCDFGSASDTFSLCIISLIEYRHIITDEAVLSQIDSLFKEILEYYILRSNIFDTMVRFYVGKSKIESALNDIEECKTINDNIGVISALIKLIYTYLEYNKVADNIKLQLIDAKDLLSDLLIKFWGEIKDKIVVINDFVKKNEYSLVPQIIYSCLYAFDKNG